MFTWFMHPNQPKWYLTPIGDLPFCVEGLTRVLAASGPIRCLTGCCAN